MTEYQMLEMLYNKSQNICDPIDYNYRQRNLLIGLCRYILERDKPKEEEVQDDS